MLDTARHYAVFIRRVRLLASNALVTPSPAMAALLDPRAGGGGGGGREEEEVSTARQEVDATLLLPSVCLSVFLSVCLSVCLSSLSV